MMTGPILTASMWVIATMQSSTSIDQVPPGDTPIAESRLQPDAPRDVATATDTQSAQIASPDEARYSTPQASQLTLERPTGAVVQAGRSDRNTQSSPALSKRAQGFETRVVKLEGTDRCSAELPSARDREYCQRIIENRSAEYAGGREPQLTPEQALLAQRNLKMIDGGTDAAIRRLAGGRSSADDNEDQSVASVALGSQDATGQPTPEVPAESRLSAETQALLDAIVRNVTASPSP